MRKPWCNCRRSSWASASVRHKQAMPLEIVTIGHVVNEHIRFPDRALGPVLGGPASYTAVVAGRLGRRVGLVTVVGADLPPGLLDVLAEAGVDMAGVKHR